MTENDICETHSGAGLFGSCVYDDLRWRSVDWTRKALLFVRLGAS